MSLQERLSEDLKDAMRQRDETRRSTIRFIRAAVQNQEIDKREALNDDEIIGVLEAMAAGERLPFTFTLDDPSGNSFISFDMNVYTIPENDPRMNFNRYARTQE